MLSIVGPQNRTWLSLRGGQLSAKEELKVNRREWLCARRLHESGMIKMAPQKLISQSTDQRFLNDLTKELKG
jgi:hypothetical protein